MHLPRSCELVIAVERREKATPILVNILRSVLVEAGKIEISGGEGRDAAEARREAVRETRLLERDADEYLDTAAFSPAEAAFG